MSEIIDAHCNNCLGTRNHQVLCLETSHWEQGDEEGAFVVEAHEEYRILKCCGCDNVNFQKQHWFSEDTDVRGRPIVHEEYYPPATYRSEPEWLAEIEDDYIEGLLQEIYTSLNNGTRRLAAMGIRACFEHVMIKEIGDQGSFARNVAKFQEAGFISRIQRDCLDIIIETGHATMHRSFSPSIEETNSLIELKESVLESIYISSTKVEALKKKVPLRKAPKGRGT